MRLDTFIAAFAAAMACASAPAQADVRLLVDGVVEIQHDAVVAASTADAETSISSATVEIVPSVVVDDRWVFGAALVLEPVAAPVGDSAFEGQGLFAQALHVQYTASAFALTLGKFGPQFGTAWDLTPGLYGTELAEDYELAEAVGVGIDVDLGRGLGLEPGAAMAAASVFTADRSPLSRSILSDRGRTQLSDGGVGNTRDLESFALTISGESATLAPGLVYHLGVRRLSSDEPGVAAETGWVAGLAQGFDVGAVRLELNAEAARFEHAQGGPDAHRYGTVGGVALFGRWNLAAAVAHRDGAGWESDQSAQLSIGRTFADRFSLDAGYKTERLDGEWAGTVGVLLAMSFSA